MHAPQRDADHHAGQAGGKCEQQVRGQHHGAADGEQRVSRHGVGQFAGRIGGEQVGGAHHHQRQRNPGIGQAGILCAQHEESFGKAHQREHQHQPDQRPERLRVIAGAKSGEGISRGGGLGYVRRFLHAEQQHRDGEQCGNTGDPEHRANVEGEADHQPNGDQRTRERADRVHGLTQAIGRAALGGRGDIGNQRIARRATDALADAVEEARGEYGQRRVGKWKQRFGQCRHAVAKHDQRLALTPAVGQHARENLRDGSRGFGDALDDAECERADAQRADQENRQQGMDHLGRHVHAQADDAQRPHAARQLHACGHLPGALMRPGPG